MSKLYNCSEVLKLADHCASVSCALNLSIGRLEDELNPDDSISQTTRSKKKSSSTTASSARFKAAARKAALMARAQVLKDGLELKQKQLQLQHDQEQLNLRAKISEVEAEERVYQMFEERHGLSDRTNAVRSSVEKSPLNPNAAEWPVCMSGNLKNAVSGAETRGASVEVKKKMTGEQVKYANGEGNGQEPPVQGKEQHVGPNSTVCNEPCLLQMISIMQLPKPELMTFNGDPLEFWMFMHSFDNSIGSAAIDDSAK